MKQCISTLAGGLMLLLLTSSALVAQDQSSQTSTLTAVQTITTADGVSTTTTETITTGKKFEDLIDQLGLDKEQQQKVKIRFSDNPNLAEVEEETIFYFRSAKDENQENHIEHFEITLGDGDDLKDEAPEKKPLLGVYTESKDGHMEITGLVRDGGAQQAGLQKGDLIVAIESNEVHSSMELRGAIQQHQVGDVVQVKYLRNGQLSTIPVTLGESKSRSYHRRNHVYNYHYDYKDSYYSNKHQDRDPCDVFIGIYTSKNRKGLRVHNIIANTAADRSTIQDGDIVVAFNYTPVASHRELVTERDKSNPGDFFTLTVLRDGEELNLDMQFTDCPKDELIEEETELPVEEIVETPQNNLEIRNFSAFPNPTYGPVTVKFEGEAQPTTIRIVDATGKVVYEEQIINFDGYYNKDIELKNAVPGNLILTITQDQKVYSESMVLMPRA